MGSRTAICLALLALPGSAQDPWPATWRVRVQVPERDALQLLPGADGLVGRVVWTPPDGQEPISVTLVRPVRTCAAAVTSDGQGLVLLAGGVRDSLDLYLVDRISRRPYVHATSGGRRLPETFNSGLGSWPLVEGPHAVLFAFERERRLHFLALDFQGRIHAAREMSLAVTGFTAGEDPDTSQLRVSFPPIGAEVVFPHPLAPRLELGQGVMEFGVPLVGREVFREVGLRNSGARDLRVAMTVTGTGFRIDGANEIALAPGASGMVRVGFKPARGERFEGQLELRANSPQSARRVALRGEGLELAAAPLPIESSVAPPRPETRSGDDRARPDPEPARTHDPVPAPPEVGGLRVEQQSAERVRVTGYLRPASSGAAAAVLLQTPAEEVRGEVGPGGAFAVHARARAGDRLHLVSVRADGAESPPVSLGQVFPEVRLLGSELEIRTRPGCRFLLAAVALDTEGQRIQRVWTAWEGRADAEGTARLDAAILGTRRVPLHVLVFSLGEDGVSRSEILRLDPDS